MSVSFGYGCRCNGRRRLKVLWRQRRIRNHCSSQAPAFREVRKGAHLMTRADRARGCEMVLAELGEPIDAEQAHATADLGLHDLEAVVQCIGAAGGQCPGLKL